MKKELSLKQCAWLEYIVMGCVWLLGGIFEIIGGEVAELLNYVIWTIGCIDLIYVMRSRKERTDEMAREHMQNAYCVALGGVLIVMLLCYIIQVIINLAGRNIVIGYAETFPFLLSVIYFAIGATFLIQERTYD